MGGRAEAYRAELHSLQDWEPYLKKHSGLPGPRGNLELLAAVVEEGDSDRLWHFSASSDEFVAACGAAGLGRIALLEPEPAMRRLHELASDPRWRVREGVAIGLQRFGREKMRELLAVMRRWARDGATFSAQSLRACASPPCSNRIATPSPCWPFSTASPGRWRSGGTEG